MMKYNITEMYQDNKLNFKIISYGKMSKIYEEILEMWISYVMFMQKSR
jgi:hypothetical protein